MRCIVAECTSNKKKGDGIKFYSFPKVIGPEFENHFDLLRRQRCDAWIRALIQKDNTEISAAIYEYVKKVRVCSKHFQNEPSQDIRSADYIPHLNLGYTPKRYYLDSLPSNDIATSSADQTMLSNLEASDTDNLLLLRHEENLPNVLHDPNYSNLETGLMKEMLVHMTNEVFSADLKLPDRFYPEANVAENLLPKLTDEEKLSNVSLEPEPEQQIFHHFDQESINDNENTLHFEIQNQIIEQIIESVATFKRLANDKFQCKLDFHDECNESSVNISHLLQNVLTCFNCCMEKLVDSSVTEKLATQNQSPNENIDTLKAQLENDRHKIKIFESRIQELEISIQKHINQSNIFINDDKRTCFYTGLPSYAVFETLFLAMEEYLPYKPNYKLKKLQILQLTLMKLRLGLKFTDLAYRFNISISTASSYFHKCLFVLYTKLKANIIWPSRDELIKTMPSIFRATLGHSRVITIIDCFEIYTEHPSKPLANAQCWSNYKHHETVKVLIGITPQGSIGFISKCYGGRSSDIFVTEDCKILDLLLPGDIVMADRGFNLHTTVELHHAKLITPTFVKGVNQLHPTDVETTRSIASLRIHVERVIGTLRQKYEILTNILPISVLSKNFENQSVIDQILVVCCGLFNLCPAIIS